jgi:hypothetical protein
MEHKPQAGFAAISCVVSEQQPVGSTVSVDVWQGLYGADGLVESTSRGSYVLIPFVPLCYLFGLGRYRVMERAEPRP